MALRYPQGCPMENVAILWSGLSHSLTTTKRVAKFGCSPGRAMVQGGPSGGAVSCHILAMPTKMPLSLEKPYTLRDSRAGCSPWA